MAMKLEKKERSVHVNISIKPSTLDAIDKNVERIAKWLIKKGADVRDVARSVNRSALITEMVERLGTEAGFARVHADGRKRAGTLCGNGGRRTVRGTLDI